MITSNQVSDVVDSMVAKKEPFTAFDITTQLRNNGKNVRHDEVKNIVHDCYNRGTMTIDYDRTSIDLVTNQRCYLYHPKTFNPQDFHAAKKAGTVVPQPQFVINVPNIDPSLLNTVPASVVIPSGKDAAFQLQTGNNPIAAIKQLIHPRNKINSTIRTLDKRGTLSIPVKTVKNIGLAYKDTCYVYEDQGKIFVSKADPNRPHSKYTVDKYNQLRISHKFTKDNSKFDVVIDSNLIVATVI